MISYLDALQASIKLSKHYEINNVTDLEEYRKKFLGVDGALKDMSQLIKEVPAGDRKMAGDLLRDYKQVLEWKYLLYKNLLIPTNG